MATNQEIFSLGKLKTTVKDIARPYMFLMTVEKGATSPGAIDKQEMLTATLKSANLPGLQLAEVQVNYFGMTYKLAGTPTFEPLTCTILVDNNYKSRELWYKALTRIFRYDDSKGPEWRLPTEYLGDVTLTAFNTQYDQAAIYKLKMAWISILAPVALSHDNKDQPLTFDATITYSYYDVTAETTNIFPLD